MKIILVSFLLSITYFLLSFLVYFISYKKIKLPDLFDVKSAILGLVSSFVLLIFFFLSLNILSAKNIEESTLNIFLFFIIAIFPTYEYFIQPIFLLYSNDLTRAKELEQKNKFLNGYKVFISNNSFANAFAFGVIPSTKAIIISKDIVENLQEIEIAAILAHEAGHLKKNHIFKLYLISLVGLLFGYLTSFYFYPIFQKYPDYIHVLRGLHGGFFYALPIWLLTSYSQRFLEYEADKFSSKKTSKKLIISALKKLDDLSNGKISSGGITHPSLDKRIKNILKVK
ncbi:M48 family metallopeptidase [Ornithobacterium rhinotracheale]